MQKENEPNNHSGLIKLIPAASVGAVIAAVLGYGISAWLSTYGLALITQGNGIHPDLPRFLALAGLNFEGLHHVRIIGSSMPGGPGGVQVSFLWPITIWAAIPALSLMLGGFVSRKLACTRGSSRFAAGALVAVPYVILLLVFRPFFCVPSVSISPPRLDIGGWNLAPESIAAELTPDVWSVILKGLIFGIIFGGVGAIGGFKTIWRGTLRKDSFWPAWMRGAFAAFAIGQIALLLLIVIFAAVQLPRQSQESEGIPARSVITFMPTAIGLADYFSHGVTLRGDVFSMPAVDEGLRERIGIITGIQSGGKKKSLPAWAYIALLIPAGALIAGGRIAARTANGSMKRANLAVRMAIIYGMLLTALVPFYSLTQKTVIKMGDMTTRSALTIGPSAAETLIFCMIIAFVFGSLGIILHKPHANS